MRYLLCYPLIVLSRVSDICFLVSQPTTFSCRYGFIQIYDDKGGKSCIYIVAAELRDGKRRFQRHLVGGVDPTLSLYLTHVLPGFILCTVQYWEAAPGFCEASEGVVYRNENRAKQRKFVIETLFIK